MDILERLERDARQWTVDDMGRHVQFGDQLDDIADAVVEERDLFSLETILDAVDSVAVGPNGDDRATVSVSRLRTALGSAGIE